MIGALFAREKSEKRRGGAWERSRLPFHRPRALGRKNTDAEVLAHGIVLKRVVIN